MTMEEIYKMDVSERGRKEEYEDIDYIIEQKELHKYWNIVSNAKGLDNALKKLKLLKHEYPNELFRIKKL